MITPAKGDGTLRRVLEDARRELHLRRSELTVLSTWVDPYRMDTKSGHRDGCWIAEQLDRAVGGERSIHWRGLHYAIIAAGDIRKPDGEVYRNTDENWKWLYGPAGKAARWLGYIDFERIIDKRNSEPVIYRHPRVEVLKWVDSGALDVTIPDVDDVKPYPFVAGFEGRQPYALTIFGEKNSLQEVLDPIAQRFEADLYLPIGEISDTQVYRMAKDGAADGRTMVVFILADCDPAGHQMAVSIGRKLQAFRDLSFPDLDFEVVPVALTVEQVRDLGLPSTPLKETEKRADSWREAFGIEQTEIDALSTLQPDVLEEIVTSAIAPFYDASLASRVRAARKEWQEAAQAIVNDQIDDEELARIRVDAGERLAELEDEIASINEQLEMVIEGHFELPEVDIPAAEIDDELARRASLISSAWTWAEATLALIARKKYGDAA